MKIHIHAQLTDGAWGGGNQFLKALRGALVRHHAYAKHRAEADTVLFNGYQDLWAIASHFFFHHKQKRIYRLGPILSLHRPGMKWAIVDYLVVLFANWFADVAVFQSEWSYRQLLIQGFSPTKKYSIIGNAADAEIFFKKELAIPDEKIKLVYSSWSPNMKKGFAYLKFLDQNLDFTKYSFTFIGNAPFVFTNIKMLAPLPSCELAAELRRHDIFVSPVADDACSNALLEGLSSGLPAVALESGGNPELVGEGGELFTDEASLLRALEMVAADLKSYYDRISVESIDAIVLRYSSLLHE